MDTPPERRQTWGANRDDTATIWPQAGNDASEVAMRPLWKSGQSRDYLSDALTLLAGWKRDGREIHRTLCLDDTQHAALTERIKVAADTLQLRPDIRRTNGNTEIRLGGAGEQSITAGEVTLAARIEDAYRTIVGSA